jgi:hypothetical protein
MSPRARTTAPKRSGSSTRRASTAKRGKGHTALDRLTKSVDAAQDALKDLRGEMSKGSSGVLKDIDKQLKDARKNLRGASKSVLKDLEGLQSKIASSTGRGSAKKTTSSARKTSGSSARKTSGASARKSTTSRSSTARKSTSSRSRSSSARSKKS